MQNARWDQGRLWYTLRVRWWAYLWLIPWGIWTHWICRRPYPED
jgi:hypothetical protein